MTKLGVPDYAAHMFIFYYALLSEVSPPTALSPFLERVFLVSAGLFLLYPEILFDLLGLGLFGVALVPQWARRESSLSGA